MIFSKWSFRVQFINGLLFPVLQSMSCVGSEVYKIPGRCKRWIFHIWFGNLICRRIQDPDTFQYTPPTAQTIPTAANPHLRKASANSQEPSQKMTQFNKIASAFPLGAFSSYLLLAIYYRSSYRFSSNFQTLLPAAMTMILPWLEIIDLPHLTKLSHKNLSNLFSLSN